MTLREKIEAAGQKLEEMEAEDKEALANEPMSLEGTARYVATEAIPSLISNIVAVPFAAARFSAKLAAAPFIGSGPAEEEYNAAASAAADYAYDRWMHPARALPEVGMVAGGAAGALIGMPNLGASLGTLSTTLARNEITGQPLTNRDIGDIMMAPAGNVPFAYLGAAARSLRGVARQVSKAATTYTSAILKPHAIEYADAVLAESRAVSDAKRALVHYVKPAQEAYGKAEQVDTILPDYDMTNTNPYAGSWGITDPEHRQITILSTAQDVGRQRAGVQTLAHPFAEEAPDVLPYTPQGGRLVKTGNLLVDTEGTGMGVQRKRPDVETGRGDVRLPPNTGRTLGGIAPSQVEFALEGLAPRKPAILATRGEVAEARAAFRKDMQLATERAKPFAALREVKGREPLENRLARRMADAKARAAIKTGTYVPARGALDVAADATAYAEHLENRPVVPQSERFPKRSPAVDYLGYDVDAELAAFMEGKKPAPAAAVAEAPDYFGYDVDPATAASSLEAFLHPVAAHETMPVATMTRERVSPVRRMAEPLPAGVSRTDPVGRALALKEYGVDQPGPTLYDIVGQDEPGALLSKSQRRADAAAAKVPLVEDTGFRKPTLLGPEDLPRSPHVSEPLPYTEPPVKTAKPVLLSPEEAYMPAIDGKLGMGVTGKRLPKDTARTFDAEAFTEAADALKPLKLVDEEPFEVTGKPGEFAEASQRTEWAGRKADPKLRLSKEIEQAEKYARLKAAAAAKVAAHIEEKRARIHAEDKFATNPDYQAIAEDAENLARIGVLEPEHLQYENNVFAKQIRKAGFLASLDNPVYQLVHKLGAAGNYVSQMIMRSNDLHVTSTYRFGKVAHGLMDKYNVQEHDLKTHGFLHVLFDHPELRDVMRAEGVAGVRNWEQQTGNRLNVHAKDHARLHEMGQFVDELKDQVYDPMWALMLKQGVNPADIADYNPNYILPTFTSKRVMTEVATDLKSIEHALNNLSPAEQRGLHGEMLRNQHSALTEKLKVAKAQSESAEVTRKKAVQTLYKPGMKPGEIINSAYKDKNTDMMFHTGLRSSIDDYISGFMKKAIYDGTNRRVNEIIKNAPWDDSSKRWVTSYALDQMSTRRMVQTKRLTEQLQRIPGIGKHITEDGLERAVNTISAYNAAVNMGLNPRFYPVNAAQTLVMGYGLVGPDAMAHGLMKVLTNWPKAYERAKSDGVVQSGLEHMWEEHGTNQRGHVRVKFLPKVLNTINGLLRGSEAVNRTLMNESAHYVAASEGLTGRDAVNRARDISRMANHGYSSAERVTASNTLAGSTVLRYKSFGLQSWSYIKHLAQKDPKAAAETMLMVVALSGTSGIPGWSMAQNVAAKYFNYNLPNYNPLDEVSHSNLSASFSPWLSIPGVTEDFTLENLAGPLLGPPAAGISGSYEQDEGKLARALGGIAGAGVMHPIRAIDEYMRGGVTTSDSGIPMMQRDVGKQIAYGLGMGESAKGEAFKHKQAIAREEEFGTDEGLAAAMEAGERAGLLDPGKALSSARRMKTMQEKKKSTFEQWMGR